MIKSLKDILVVSDMDNTLLTAKNGIPPCNVETIRLFTKLGGNFTVATGRTIESVRHYLSDLQLSAPAIVYGGAVIYDFKTEQRIQSKVLPKPEAIKAIEDIQKKFPLIGIEVMGENGKIYVARANKVTYEHTVYEKLEYTLCDLDNISCGWNKVLFAGNNKMLCDVRDYVHSKQYNGIYFVATNDIYFEIMMNNASKGKALEELCHYINIDKENTFAIGDYYNDVELMRAAGHAVAVANAPPQVRAEADEITAECMLGGVGQFLYKLIKKYA